MSKQMPFRPHLRRELAVYRYGMALEQGDFATVAAVLQQAEQDAVLARLLAEWDQHLISESQEVVGPVDPLAVRQLLEQFIAPSPSTAASNGQGSTASALPDRLLANLAPSQEVTVLSDPVQPSLPPAHSQPARLQTPGHPVAPPRRMRPFSFMARHHVRSPGRMRWMTAILVLAAVVVLFALLFRTLAFSQTAHPSVPVPVTPTPATVTLFPTAVVPSPTAVTPIATPVLGSGTITEFPLPLANSYPCCITVGPDGNLWFTEGSAYGNRIGRITAAGHITEYSLPSADGEVIGITAGPDGNLWFSWGGFDARIGRITPQGQVTEYPLPNGNADPRAITAGPDGNLWFTEFVGNQIGRITPTGQLTEYPLPHPESMPWNITAGPDGNLWLAENGGHRIGRITPSGHLTEFPLPVPAGQPHGITRGADGNLWFTEEATQQMGRMTPEGTLTEFPLASKYASGARDIAVGPDGNLWCTAGSQIVRMSVTGQTTIFFTHTGVGGLGGITAGPDGHLWFVETQTSRIGRLIPNA